MSVSKFLADISYLIDRLGLPRDCIEDYFLKSLPEAMRTSLAVVNKLSLPELVSIAQSMSETSAFAKAKSVDTNFGAQDMTLISMGMAEMQTAIKDLQTGEVKTQVSTDVSKIQKSVDEAVKQGKKRLKLRSRKLSYLILFQIILVAIKVLNVRRQV